MIIKFHKKSVEKFPEWKALVHPKGSKLIDIIKSDFAKELLEDKDDDDLILSLEDASNLEDKYFIPYKFLPKEILKYIKKIGGKF